MPRAHAESRQPTNLTLDARLVKEAKDLGLNLSRLLEDRLREVIAAERRRRWLEENEAAFEAYDRFVEKNGVFNEEERGW